MSHLPLWIRKLNPFTPTRVSEVAPDRDDIIHLLAALEANFSSAGETIYKARNEIKILDTEAGKIVVKRFGKIYLMNRFAYAWLRASKARRSYRNGLELRKRGIGTPEPLAYTEQYKGALLGPSMYLYGYYAGEDNMRRVLKEKDYPDREALLRSFARYACLLLDRGVFHKDFSPGNILFERKDGEYQFMLIDINRIVFGPILPEKRRRIFRRLFADEETLGILAREYARLSSEDADEVTAEMVSFSRRFIARKTRKKKLKKWLGLSK